MHKSFTADPTGAVDVFLYTIEAFKSLENDPFPNARAFAEGQAFTGASGQVVLVPGDSGKLAHVLYGLGKGKDALAVAGLSAKLPKGSYRIVEAGSLAFHQIAAGWADGAYRFDRYLKEKAAPPQLVIPEDADADALSREADACALLRDLVNTPAADMGPQDIQAAISDLAERFGAKRRSLARNCSRRTIRWCTPSAGPPSMSRASWSWNGVTRPIRAWPLSARG